MSVRTASWSLYVFLFLAIVATATPFLVRAGEQANAMCVMVFPQCPPCGPIPGSSGKCDGGGRNQYKCPATCQDAEPAGITIGHCEAMGLCKGDTTTGGEGKKGGGLGMDKLMSELKGLMDALKGGGGGGGGGSGTGGTGS